ncbi:hypothetical protein [Streptomyces mirabilis]
MPAGHTRRPVADARDRDRPALGDTPEHRADPSAVHPHPERLPTMD